MRGRQMNELLRRRKDGRTDNWRERWRVEEPEDQGGTGLTGGERQLLALCLGKGSWILQISGLFYLLNSQFPKISILLSVFYFS